MQSPVSFILLSQKSLILPADEWKKQFGMELNAPGIDAMTMLLANISGQQFRQIRES
jgi:hypothetical protein